MVSQQDVDNVVASVGDADGQLQAAQAALSQANPNLSYTHIESPLDGVAGVALVRIGNLVGQDAPTLLTTVSQLDPIRVNFPLSEVDYIRRADLFKNPQGRDLTWTRKQFAKVDATGVTDDGDPGVELQLSDGTTYPHKGVVVSVDREIDPSTGTIQLQALVPNPDGILRPGQFGRVRIHRMAAGHDVLAVPEKALISVQGTYSVGVIGPDNKVQLRRIDVGPSVNGLRVVEKGLSEGDHVVVDGVQKITDGALVDPRPAPDTPGAKN
jgi:membrane fusion protein (multidrug efflux system)